MKGLKRSRDIHPESNPDSRRIAQINGSLDVSTEGMANEYAVGNSISTSKYTIFSWIPKSLFEQFRRIANRYFLAISILMLIGSYAPEVFESPLDWLSTFGTLIVVLFVTSFKEGLEDLHRHQADKVENEHLCKVLEVLSDGKLRQKEKACSSICVGDIVKVDNGEKIPADLVCLLTDHQEEQCYCYVETSNIDGETNLKMKQVPTEAYKALQGSKDGTLDDVLLNGVQGQVEFETPNNRIHTFTGRLTLRNSAPEKSETIPLDAENLLLRGSSIRNTKWIYGLVVFTGSETKIMQNSRSAPSKYSTVETIVNIAIYIMFASQCILVTISMICSETAQGLQDHTYLMSEETDYLLPSWLANWFTFIILYNNFIPISLYVTIEVVNMMQAILINNDLNMWCDEKEEPALTRQSNLCQEIGRIEYVFSDKTGTLTRNQMEFKCLSCAGKIYGQTQPEDPKVDPEVTKLLGCIPCRKDSDSLVVGTYHEENDNISDIEIGEPAKRSSRQISTEEKLELFFVLLAVCHTVVVETNTKTGEKAYQAESPDEAALVDAAKSYGYELVKRSNTQVTIVATTSNTELSYKVLAVNAFNSTRKRMSMVVIDEKKGIHYLLCKGADNIMLERCRVPEKDLSVINDHLTQFSTQGLRTLVLGYRVLSEKDSSNWCDKFRDAACAMENRGDRLMDVAEEIEKDMAVVGVTAIEDRLQDGVPETIDDIMKAGVKIWVLTGDKEETAINIALSCKLLNANQHRISITGMTEDSNIFKQIEEGAKEIGLVTASLSDPIPRPNLGDKLKNFFSSKSKTSADDSKKCTPKKDFALIVDGPTLIFILKSPKLRNAFLKVCVECKAVVACRVSPSQKADIVALVKDGVQPTPVTLAIGDGANDVGMILEAHVGVGISGNEGRQAVNSSDFAFAQFRFLKRLMIVHGRWNYIRISKVFLYSMHKNVVLTLLLFWYSFYNFFSATSFFESYVYSGFNFALGLPIFFLGFTEKDISAEYAEKHPQVYITGRENLRLRVIVIIEWILNALAYAVLISIITYNVDTVRNYGLYSLGTSVYTALILALQVKICLMTKTWNWMTHAVLWISIGGYLLILCIYGYYLPFYGESWFLFGSGRFWFVYVWTVPLVCGIFDLFLEYIKVELYPTPDDHHAEVANNLEKSKPSPTPVTG